MKCPNCGGDWIVTDMPNGSKRITCDPCSINFLMSVKKFRQQQPQENPVDQIEIDPVVIEQPAAEPAVEAKRATSRGFLDDIIR